MPAVDAGNPTRPSCVNQIFAGTSLVRELLEEFKGLGVPNRAGQRLWTSKPGHGGCNEHQERNTHRQMDQQTTGHEGRDRNGERQPPSQQSRARYAELK